MNEISKAAVDILLKDKSEAYTERVKKSLEASFILPLRQIIEEEISPLTDTMSPNMAEKVKKEISKNITDRLLNKIGPR